MGSCGSSIKEEDEEDSPVRRCSYELELLLCMQMSCSGARVCRVSGGVVRWNSGFN